MPDIIKLLPDNIANQIAAGEVVQRPSNIVKELIENCIDAGATEIKIILEKSGTKAIQVIDNGKGMSPTDARMCFERHATSKINDINDIFRITTMGFRGEALASIAAVASVILKTKTQDDVVGTLIEIENSNTLKQEPTPCETGTNIIVKNIFFNVPARKNFLKNDAIEFKHCIDEFLRIALIFHNISFIITHNSELIYNLSANNNWKNRLIQIFGKNYEQHLLNVYEVHKDFHFKGYIGKPEISKKTRGNQYFFINNRFIKNNYLNHAITSAYQNIINKDSFPFFVINIDLDTSLVDINVHPTKQEVKFTNDKELYTFLNATIKHTLHKYAVVPSIDFNLDTQTQQLNALNIPINEQTRNQINQTSLYKEFTQINRAHFIPQNNSSNEWHNFYQPNNAIQNNSTVTPNLEPIETEILFTEIKKENWLQKEYAQFQNEYIITFHKNYILVVNQQLAHQVILTEKYQHSYKSQNIQKDTLLFPIEFTLTPDDSAIFKDLQNDLEKLGYTIKHLNKHQYKIISVPTDIKINDAPIEIEKIIESYKLLKPNQELQNKEKLIRCLSLRNSIKIGTILNQEFMQNLVHNLFQCANPLYTYGSLKSFILINKKDLDRLF